MLLLLKQTAAVFKITYYVKLFIIELIAYKYDHNFVNFLIHFNCICVLLLNSSCCYWRCYTDL